MLFLALIGVIASIVIQTLPKKAETDGDVKLSYVITVTDVSEEVMAQLTKDQTVYDVDSGKTLGVISSVTSTPYIIKGVDEETGALVANAVPGRYNINVTVTSSAKPEGNSYQINEIVIACGVEYRFRTPTAYLSGSCISLKTE